LPGREQQNVLFPRAFGSTTGGITGAGLTSITRPGRLQSEGLETPTGPSKGSIDWRGMAAFAAERLAGSGGTLGRWLVALGEPPADESAVNDIPPTGEAALASSATPKGLATSDPPAPTSVSVPPNAVLVEDQKSVPAAEVYLRNPAENDLPVAFLMGEQVIKLAAGEGRSFTSSSLTVRFDRGGRFGSATKTLTEGRYEFRLSPDGWDIVADTP
jgi:hypothetical protein